MNTFFLEVKTPDKLIFSGEVESLIVEHPSGKEGYLANHETVLKEIAAGVLQIKLGNKTPSFFDSEASSDDETTSEENPKTKTIPVDGGFISFSENKAVVFIR